MDAKEGHTDESSSSSARKVRSHKLESVYDNWDLNLHVPFTRQFRAVFLKNVTLTIRQRKSFIFCLITSILLMLVPIFVIRFPGAQPYTVYETVQSEFFIPSYGDFPSEWLDGNETEYYYYLSQFYYWNVFDETDNFGDQPMDPALAQSNLYKGLMGQLAQKAIIRDEIRQYNYGCTYLVGMERYNGSHYILSYNLSNMFFRHETSIQALEDNLRVQLDYSNYYCNRPYVGVHAKMVEFNLSAQFKADLDIYTGGDDKDAIQASSLIQTAFLGKALSYTYTAEELSNSTQFSTPMITAQIFYLPRNERSGKQDIENGFQVTFYWIFSMLTLCLVMPILTQRIVIERGDGLVDLSRMMGLSRTAYWTANLALDFGIYFIVLALLLIVAGISSSKVGIAMISPWVFFPFLIHGITCAFEAYFFSFFFRRLRPATLFAYVFSLAQMAVAAVFNMALVHPTDGFPGYLMWWPGFAFHRLTYLGLMNNATKNHWIRTVITKNLRDSMLCLCFETIILIGIVFAFDRWGPSKLGNRGTIGDLLRDFVSNKWRSLWSNRNKKNKKSQNGIDDKEAYELSGLDRLLVADEDQRVAAEREAVLSGFIEDPIMLVKNVTKVYAEGTKHFTALGGISLSLRAGDCFGLLGPNGAGKSTLVSIMSGIMIPTSGSVSVARSEKRCCIGFCPQDDIFYEDLSVEEHLLYYARLKGKGPGEDYDSVNQILSDTSMLDERRKYAKNLSGGQKRRLSVASALCGDPMVIFLDEPSSSLDPASRLALWEMIQSVSQTRCTLITTHSMEEAEVLCNRIGIIKDGMMVCLGTPTQLKKDYGRGYKLTASMLHGHSIQPVLDKVLKVAPAASISSHRHGTFEIQLGANAMLSKVSQCVESRQSKLGIEYWSLSRNGLDEVFLRIVEDRGVMRRKKDGTLAPKKSAWEQKPGKGESSPYSSEEKAHLGEESV